MVKIKNPLMSLKTSGSLTKTLTFLRRAGSDIAEKKPEIKDVKSLAQLSWRHMYQKAVALWHALSAAEKLKWESDARPKHMTGFAWFMSQCLRPNPGIYLPLQGGVMQGIIDMAGYVIESLSDPAAAQDADTKAARDAAIAAAIGGSLTCDIYGYDGANWQKLLVESAAFHNLRVQIYDRGFRLASDVVDESFGAGGRGILTLSPLYGWSGAAFLRNALTEQDSDAQPTGLFGIVTSSYQMFFNGATWERARSYPTGILKVGRAGIGLLDTRMTGTGQVGATQARKLYWLSMNPSAANSLIELTDAAAGGAAVKWDMFHSSRMGHTEIFDPPMEFSTGIYVQTWTAMTSAIFGYL